MYLPQKFNGELEHTTIHLRKGETAMPQDITTWVDPFDPSDPASKCRGPLIGHGNMNSKKTPEQLLRKAKKKWAKKERQQEERERLGL